MKTVFKVLAALAILLACCTERADARERYSFWCGQGNQTIKVLGYTSSTTTPVQASYPACTVTVYITNTITLAAIYSDNSGTVLANPFTLGVSPEVSTNGLAFFYANNGTYDIQVTGTGITSFTVGAVSLFDPLGSGTASVSSVGLTAPAWLSVAGSPVTTAGTLAVTAATGQTSHQVIGTCGSATSFGPCALTAGDLPSLSGTYLPLTGGTMAGNLLFVDSTFDIGATGATRPRDLWLARNAAIAGTLAVTGHATLEGVTSTGAAGTGALVFATSPALVTPALGTPATVVLTNATGLPLATGVSGTLATGNGGTGTTATLTGLVRGGAPYTASELSGDAATSGSNVVTVTGIRGAPVTGTSGNIVSFGGGNTISDSGVASANAVQAAAAASSAKQTCVSSGTSKSCSFIDFPERIYLPAAVCTNATATALWSIGAGGSVTCRAGTNNKVGVVSITGTSSTFAQFQVSIPMDWDTGANPYVRVQVASTDTVTGHTIIPQVQVSCAKGDGSTTDDVTFNAAHSLGTITLNSVANQFWSTSSIQMNSSDMTGCAAGSLMIVQVGRATDTATNAGFYSASMTFPRLLAVQAN